jgi:very-short-patch-repair endonuclease
MKIIDENGKQHVVNLSKYYASSRENCSALHARLREFLTKKFPAAQILEEVHIPSYNIYLDFYIPLYRLACEADGSQHENFTPFFHKTKLNFAAAKGRDNKKRTFCELNNITLIRFSEKEDEVLWTAKLLKKS